MSSQEEKKEKKVYKTFKAFITSKIGIGVIIVAILAILALGVGDSFFTESETVKVGFENIGELATQSAYMVEVSNTKNAREVFGVNVPFTQSQYIYSYGVNVKAGFDFKEIEWSEKNGVIEVKLPKVKILSAEIDTDSFKVYLEDKSIFRPHTPSDSNKELEKLKEKAKEDAISNGVLENAYENAEKILTPFFEKEYDLKEYKIKFIKK